MSSRRGRARAHRGLAPKKAPGWDPLCRAELADPENAARQFAAANTRPPDEVWGSALYSVMVRYGELHGELQARDKLLWLSIHRRDRAPIRDWRHMQAIKNEIAGPERVALEVYPAESNLVDTSNEYHLWVLPVGVDVPFGFQSGGLLMDAGDELPGIQTAGAVQRPWEPGIPTGRGALCAVCGDPVEPADRAVIPATGAIVHRSDDGDGCDGRYWDPPGWET